MSMRQKVNKNNMKGFKLSGGFVPAIVPEFIFFKDTNRWRGEE